MKRYFSIGNGGGGDGARRCSMWNELEKSI